MLHSVAGLNVEQVSLVVHSLNDAGCKDLASLYITSLALIDSMLSLLLKEMFSTRKHILYWHRLARSNRWELLMYLWNSKAFKALFARRDRDYLILDDSDLMLKHAEMLRCDLNEMSIFLDRINAAGAELKMIYVQLVSMGGSVSDARRKGSLPITSSADGMGSSGAGVGAASAPATADIGVRLGLSNSALGTKVQESAAEQDFVLGLAIPSEDEDGDMVVREGGIDAWQESQRRWADVGAGAGGGSGTSKVDKESELAIIRTMTNEGLERCLLLLADCLAEYLPHLLSTPATNTTAAPNDTTAAAATSSSVTVVPSNAAYATLNPTGKRSGLNQEELEVVFCCLQEFVEKLCFTRGSKEFPMKLTQARVHKPSDTERFWFRNVLGVVCGALTVKTAIDLWRDGTVANAIQFVQSKLRDHIVEPLEKLAAELFDTIRKREYVVTREECEESRQALHRMLKDFSQSTQGSTLIADMKEKIREALREQQEAAASIASKLTGREAGAASAATSSPTVSSGTPSAPSSTPGPLSAALVADAFTPEQAMAALMSAYEQELQSPVKGLIWGNLMTAILIQMQKLKVHTEAAMLTMDQILASNELTIAATAAMPAFAFFGLTLFWLRKWLQPRAASPGLATMHLRLIMSDVERSLLEVQEIVHHQQVQPSRALDSSGFSVGPHLGGRTVLQRADSTGSATILAASTSPVANRAAKVATPSIARGRSHSLNSADESAAASELRVLRYQRSLRERRLLVARGMLCFNLVRLRSEFQSLFGTERGTGNAGSSKSRALTLTRGSSSRRPMLSASLGLGRLTMFGGSRSSLSALQANAVMASSVRQWRIRRSSSIAAGADQTGAGEAQPAADSAAEADAQYAALSAQMLQLIQREERADFRGPNYGGVLAVLVAAADVLRAFYSLLFSPAGEELTVTTQYASLSRDIALLEAPVAEVSMEQKLSTAARMRATYTCLMPR